MEINLENNNILTTKPIPIFKVSNVLWILVIIGVTITVMPKKSKFKHPMPKLLKWLTVPPSFPMGAWANSEIQGPSWAEKSKNVRFLLFSAYPDYPSSEALAIKGR